MTVLLPQNGPPATPSTKRPDLGSVTPQSQPFPRSRGSDSACFKKRWRNAMTTMQNQPVHTEARLTLNGVLASALPHDLGTAQAASRYTVPAVFSRRPQPRELDLLQGKAVARRLADEGYSDVELRVSDRRLLITNTNLQDLKSGLAHLIGTILSDISEQAAIERTSRTEELDALGLLEEQRLEAIRQSAAEIHFD